jgi:hypothetical protein
LGEAPPAPAPPLFEEGVGVVGVAGVVAPPPPPPPPFDVP